MSVPLRPPDPVRLRAEHPDAGVIDVRIPGETRAASGPAVLGNLLARLPGNRSGRAAGCDMPTVVAELTDRVVVRS